MKLKYGVGVDLFVFVIACGAVLLRSYVLSVLWRWFMVPVGLPVIGMAHAYGMSMLVGLVTAHLPPIKARDIADDADPIKRDATDAEKAQYLGTQVARMVLVPLFVWAVGYGAHFAMGW